MSVSHLRVKVTFGVHVFTHLLWSALDFFAFAFVSVLVKPRDDVLLKVVRLFTNLLWSAFACGRGTPPLLGNVLIVLNRLHRRRRGMPQPGQSGHSLRIPTFHVLVDHGFSRLLQ